MCVRVCVCWWGHRGDFKDAAKFKPALHYGEREALAYMTARYPVCYASTFQVCRARRVLASRELPRRRRGPFNSTPMGFNSSSFGSEHVRPKGRTCGAWPPNEIKKNTHPENITALFS